MGRKVTPKAWLQDPLNDECLELVKRNLQKFKDQCQKDSEGQYPASIELLRQFIAFMGKNHKRFREIPDESISTTKYKGMIQIYELVRKKVKAHLDEKTPTP